MTIIVFLIDTSASMNQRTFIGARPTLLDIAKGAVESFVKLRQRNPESRFDRYMLFTSEEIPNNIKAGWKENLATFMNELKNVKATGLSTIGPAIKNIFDVLNINRMQSGIDTYGSGRSPFFLEPSVIVCITDGGKLSSPQGVQDDIFPLPKSNQIPGAELTREIYRWDQRLFGLVLRLTGTPTPETMGIVPSDNSPLDKLCEQTGGRSYAVRTHRMFQQCIESLVQKVQSGVVINFEKIGPDPQPTLDGKDACDIVEIDKENQQMNIESSMCGLIQTNGSGGGGGILGSSQGNWTGTSPPIPQSSYIPSPQNSVSTLNNTNLTTGISSTAWHNCRKMIYVPRPPHRGGSHNCFWPIPESYWPDSSLMSLPARSAHPNLKFTCTSLEPMVIDNLPFDKYELEPSPLTQFILSRKQPTTCWQVFIANSSKNSDVGHPFGYLKASTTKPCVNLFVMPYNYPVLLPLLDDLFKVHRMKPSKEWRTQFDNYLRTMPPYYATPLKRALDRMGVSNLIPDKFEVPLSFPVMSQLKKLKNQAKIEYEKVCAEVEKRVNQNNNIIGGSSNGSSSVTIGGTHEGIKVQQRRPLGRYLTSNHLLTGNGKFDKQKKLASLRDQVNEYTNFTIYVRENEIQPQVYRNPFDISRLQLIDQLARMRANFLQQSLNHLLTDRGQDQLHCKPISQMGNYQDYLKKMNPPLREIESAPMRQHMFGNPFKIDKRMSMMVDEADVDLSRGSGVTNQAPGEAGRGIKRPNTDPPMLGITRNNKRRKGPIPPEFTLQRLVSPSPSPPSSPNPHLEERLEIPPSLSPSPVLPIQPHIPFSGHIPLTVPLVPEIPASPLAAPEPPLSPVSGLIPSPTVITPGYLHQVSPPGSPAPYPRMDLAAHAATGGAPYPIVNGDIDLQYSNEMKRESDSEDEREEDPYDVERSVKIESDAYGTLPSDREITSPNFTPHVLENRNGILNEADYSHSRISELLPDNNGLTNNGADTTQTALSNKILLLACFKELKKPGREFSKLFTKLEDIQGSSEARVQMFKKIMSEAMRFKRHSLVTLLRQQIDAMGNGLTFPFNSLENSIPRNIVINGHKR